MSDFERIRWRSRRGLLEMDIILERFLAKEWDALSESEKSIYVEILDLSDNDLSDLIYGRAELKEPRWATVLEKLQHA